MKRKLIVILFIVMIMVSGCSIKKVEDLSSAEKFAKEYSVSKDNSFKYIDIDEVLKIFEEGNGIIFFGDSDDEDSRDAVLVFSQAIIDSKINDVVVYYYNPVVIRDDKTSEYMLLSDYLNIGEDENYLSLPDIYFVRNGKIIEHSNDKVINNDNDSIDECRDKLKNKYIELLNKYYEKDTSADD